MRPAIAALAFLLSLTLGGCFLAHEAGEEGDRPILCPLTEPLPDFEAPGPLAAAPVLAVCREAGLALEDSLWVVAIARGGGAARCGAERDSDGVALAVETGGVLGLLASRPAPCPLTGALPDPLRVHADERTTTLALDGSDAVCVAGEQARATRDVADEVRTLCALRELGPLGPGASYYSVEVGLGAGRTRGPTACEVRVDRRRNRIVLEPRSGDEPRDGITCVLPIIPLCEEPWTLVIGDRSVPLDRLLAVDACLSLE